MANPMYKKGDLVLYQGVRYVVVGVRPGAFDNYYDLGMTEFSNPELVGVKEVFLCSAVVPYVTSPSQRYRIYGDDIRRMLGFDVPNITVKNMGWAEMAKVLADMQPKKKPSVCAPKRVIFSPPATICFWEDGTKTIVKCTENDNYDPQIGIAMCILKHCCGNDNSYKKLFKAAKEFKTE